MSSQVLTEILNEVTPSLDGVLLQNMTWSYSKLLCYRSCPYQFYLRYILHERSDDLFYATYGTFIHSLLAGLYDGKYTKDELVPRYIQGFFSSVRGKSPGLKVFGDYYAQGLQAMQNPWYPHDQITGIETKILYDIGKYKFTGFIDLTLLKQDNSLVIVDHKSHNLSPRSNRKKPTLKDQELDNYLKQLYLYSAGIEQTMGRKPDWLVFNCYRSGIQIEEPFKEDAYQESLKWALDTIDEIERCDWPALGSFYQCRYICDVARECEWKGV